MPIRKVALFALGFALVNSSFSYDLATHAKITNAAFVQSVLGSDIGLQRTLGIEGWTLPTKTRDAPFEAEFGREMYFDILGAQINARQAQDYEFLVLTTANLAADTNRLNGWLMRGVIREDDGGTVIGNSKGEPSDDPFERTNRFCNHFFDPTSLSGRGLTGSCLSQTPIYDATQWALGSLSPFTSPAPAQVDRRNHFTILDAREAMWRALTLRDGSGAQVPERVDLFTLSSEDLRRVYWATTFRALGDVLHLVQDMAQPQHTRDEAHYPENKGYEEYIDARARRVRTYTIDGTALTATAGELPDLIYAGYPIPRFSRYSDYWSTVVTSGVVLGLADYSNRGFLTLKNNIGDTKYAKPPNNASSYTAVRTATDFFGLNSNYLFGTVNDDVLNSTDGITMSTQSVFQQFGISTASYTLSKRNYDDRASLLIPRAVAYSAGLLDYFFRGSMEISLPDSGLYAVVDHADFAGEGVPATDVNGFKGFGKIRIKLQNTTSAINTPNSQFPHDPQTQDMGAGTLAAVAKFHRNLCYVDDLSGEKGANGNADTCRSAAEEILVSQFQSVASVPSVPKEFEFTFDQQIPINARDLYLQVVFRGALGQEADAVVVQTQDISEPTYITFLNSTDYFTIGGSLVDCAILPQGCGNARSVEAAYQFYRTGPSGPAGARVAFDVLPVQRIARVAFLTDSQPDPQSIYDNNAGNPIAYHYGPDMNEWNFLSDGSVFKWDSPVANARGIYYARNIYTYLVGLDGTLTSPGDQVPVAQMTVPVLDPHPVRFSELTIPLITQ